MIIPDIWENKIDVPNHQPVLVSNRRPERKNFEEKRFTEHGAARPPWSLGVRMNRKVSEAIKHDQKNQAQKSKKQSHSW